MRRIGPDDSVNEGLLPLVYFQYVLPVHDSGVALTHSLSQIRCVLIRNSTRYMS